MARDLDALINTMRSSSTQDLSRFEHVRHSILNFGLPDIAHRIHRRASRSTTSRTRSRQVLIDYEPRLVAGIDRASSATTAVDPAELKVRFIVRADLLCEPLNVPVEFVADVELDTGKIAINRL